MQPPSTSPRAQASRWQCHATFTALEPSVFLSVLTKRTYAWSQGRIVPADEQKPLAFDIEEETREGKHGGVITQGCDVWPIKLATDVVVSGKARARAGQPTTSMSVGVSVGGRVKRIQVIGSRYIQYAGKGSLRFSNPKPFTEVELSWWNAYGGIDPMVLPLGLEDTPTSAGRLVPELFPGAYPRNPVGTGYLVLETPELLDGFRLPLLEDPRQPLTAETFLVKDPKQWWRRPQPAGFGWWDTLWFPRIVNLGGKPYHLPPAMDRGERLRELSLGLVTEDQLTRKEARTPNLRFLNEAAPDMIFPFLNGDEVIRLEGMSANAEESFRLPAERPTVSARLDAQALVNPTTCLHTLAIDAESHEFYLVWSTRFAVPASFADEIAEGLPFDEAVPRASVVVDGMPLELQHWPQPKDEEEPI
jgi:hypothetical protein